VILKRSNVMKRTVKICVGMLGVLLTVSLSIAETPTVDEIVTRANLANYYTADDGRSDVMMTITDAQGRTRERTFVILRRDVTDGGQQKFYVYFKKPSDVRKMVFMVHKNINKDDDRWLYLPALDLVKRIAASDKRTSFVGSHFLYEDVSGRSVTEDTHELVETTDEFYVIKNIPKNPAGVEFSSYTVWVDKQSYIMLKAEYLGKDGQKYREVEALEIKNIQEFPTVVKFRIRDLASGGETVAILNNIKYNINLEDKIFTERYLRRPPREVRN